MEKEILKILTPFFQDAEAIDCLAVSLFLHKNNLGVRQNELIRSLVIGRQDELWLPLQQLIFLHENQPFSFEELMGIFEVAVPEKDKVTNGAVYTPFYIKEYIVLQALNDLDKDLRDVLASDLSCGCGGFLFTLAKQIHLKTNKSFEAIFKENLFGLDISDYCIHRSRILLSLLALSEGEDKPGFHFNLHVDNALRFNWFEIEKIGNNRGFDLVVGNPPYVRTKHIDVESKSLLSKWKMAKTGNPDLYIAFFNIGLHYLRVGGILGYITANSFFKSINARGLRSFLQANNYGVKIIDFGHELIFGKKSTYTCLCFASLNYGNGVKYSNATSHDIKSYQQLPANFQSYRFLDAQKGWLLNNDKVVENIKKMEHCGKPLKKLFKIRNGIATLANDVFIFRPERSDRDYFYLKKNGKEYAIEKNICRNIIKPNILQSEKAIESELERLVFPYVQNGDDKLKIMDESFFKTSFPSAYQYLSHHQSRLQKRDKGNGNYEAWYAFGRTQAISDKGTKLLFPYMAKKPRFILSDKPDLLIYCGYAIFSEDFRKLKVLKKVLQSEVFDYYIRHTSKPYAGYFYSYAKNYVENFSICDLNYSEEEFLLHEDNPLMVNRFLLKKYKLDCDTVLVNKREDIQLEAFFGHLVDA